MRVDPCARDPRPVEDAPTPTGGTIMVRYFYGWAPLLVVGATAVLLCPYLALIAFAGVALAALAALVSVPYLLGRAISRRWHSRSDASLRVAAAAAHAYAPVHAHAAQPTMDYRKGA